MKTAISLIFWTIFGAIALTGAIAGHAIGWIGVLMAGAGIKEALWPSKAGAEWTNSFDIDGGSCGGGGCGSGGCGGCGGCGG